MRTTTFALLTVPLVLAATVLAAAPAQAATQPLFGTTVDVTVLPSNNSLLGETAYIPSSGGGVLVTLGVALAADVDFELREGATVVGTCTVATGNTQCSIGVALPAGSHSMTAYFTQSAVTVQYSGTLFSVLNVGPTVKIQWRDASGAWVDGSGIGLLLYGPTVLRCVVTNNSNASFVFGTFSGFVTYLGGGPDSVPITGGLAAGATGYYPLWSGSVNQSPSGSCSGSVTFPDATGNGGGNGGGAIPLTGTFAVTPQPAPGRTVTVTGAALVPPVIQTFPVTFDGVEGADSPGLTFGPDFDFAVDVMIPTNLAPGIHVIAVHSLYSGRDVVLAQFTFEVAAPALAATGTDVAGPIAAGTLVLALGTALVVIGRRRRVA